MDPIDDDLTIKPDDANPIVMLLAAVVARSQDADWIEDMLSVYAEGK